MGKIIGDRSIFLSDTAKCFTAHDKVDYNAHRSTIWATLMIYSWQQTGTIPASGPKFKPTQTAPNYTWNNADERKRRVCYWWWYREAALEVKKRLAKEEGSVLETTRKVYLIYQIFYLLSLLGQIQPFYLSIALCDILGLLVSRMYLAPFKHIDAHSVKRCHIGVRFHTCHSRCCLYSSSTTSFSGPQSTPAPFHPSITAHWRQTIARTSRIAGQCGTLSGVVLSQSYHPPGLPSTQIFHPLRSEWQTVGLKNVYGIHCYHLQSIDFRCSSVHCFCLSMC